MKKYSCILLILSIISYFPVNGQTDASDITLILEDLYTRITASGDDNEKIRLNDSVNLIIGNYARSDSVFTHKYDNLRYLGQILSPDKKVKIITWNLFLINSPNRYFCYFIKKGKKDKSDTVYFLTGTNRTEQIRTDITYTTGNWYGALYYDILPFKFNKKINYILLGFDFGNIDVSRKIIDVLTFTPENNLQFGLACFIKEGKNISREVIDYSPEGIVTLRLESKKMIVFDQLSKISTGHGDGSEMSGAGISFDGYVFKKGYWRFVPDIDVKNKKKD